MLATVSLLSLKTVTLLLNFCLLPDIEGDSSSSLLTPPLVEDNSSLHISFCKSTFTKSDCSGKEQSREKKDKDTSSYPGSFHNTEVVQSPLHFQGDFTIITKITTAQYFQSMRLHKTMLKHTRKSLPMLKH
ncbi:hypothetical protein MTR_8g087753 [Medicago truncatula]|uniref:Transmembrane protein n=1 Tax=Medicago truncatula TaxID=3880 RepID=A0A072TV06_MEDTR|nr:hypothetical protein MTR_8g087753 [Medicago truncatula]